MPVDFTGNPAAFVEMGDGGAHDPQIKFAADDNSCRWNGFPVCIVDPPPMNCGSFTPLIDFPTHQLLPFITTPGGGTSQPSQAQWPALIVYNYLRGLLCGYKLQARIRFNAHGTTSVGSVQVGQCTPGKPGPILGDYDSGVFDISCLSCSTADYHLALIPRFTNFNPIPPAQVQIDGGILDVNWATGGSGHADFEPDIAYSIQWRPPCYVAQSSADLDAGLYIQLPTDGCGVRFKTYTQIGTDVNALGVGITATTLGGHGSDLAKADPSCGGFPYCCDLAGAICSGSVDDIAG